MTQKIEFWRLMNLAAERIRQYLPKNYEMDDNECDEENEIFQICIFDSTSFESYYRGPADRFRFYRYNGESDKEMINRWNREVNEFCERWNKK